jgi:predicted nucleic acid-binding protein
MINLRKVGKPVGSVEVLISAIAINRGLTVVTNDKDFSQLRKWSLG